MIADIIISEDDNKFIYTRTDKKRNTVVIFINKKEILNESSKKI